MRFLSFIALIAFIALMAGLSPLPAGKAQATDSSPSAQEAIVKAETYLRGLDTARARFQQTAPDGSQLTGTFYLDRPGKLRFEYDDPVEDFIVADGRFIYFYDSAMGEQSNAPIGQTLADFLLRSDLRLSGDIKVTDVEREGGYLKLVLVQAEDPGAGALVLGFSEEPMTLRKWRVLDATGAITEIALYNMETGLALPDNLFVYFSPQDKDPYNRNE